LDFISKVLLPEMNEELESIAESVDFLNILDSKMLKKKEKEKILTRVRKGQIRKLSTLLFNTLNGGLPTVRTKTMELLTDKRNLETIKILLDPKVSIARKKRTLVCHPKKFSSWSSALVTDLHTAIHDGMTSSKEEETAERDSDDDEEDSGEENE